MNATAESVSQFFEWLRRAMPRVYRAVQAQGVPLGAVDFGRVLDNVVNAGQRYLEWDQNRRLLDIQVARARAGLPPLNAEQYQPGINAGISQGTRSDITLWLLIGGAALLGFAMLRR